MQIKTVAFTLLVITSSHLLAAEPAPTAGASNNQAWAPAQNAYGPLIEHGRVYGCMKDTPLSNSIPKGELFTQTHYQRCQDYTRTAQKREQNLRTQAFRNVGEPFEQKVTEGAGFSHKTEEMGTQPPFE